jgi:hypothetical protein
MPLTKPVIDLDESYLVRVASSGPRPLSRGDIVVPRELGMTERRLRQLVKHSHFHAPQRHRDGSVVGVCASVPRRRVEREDPKPAESDAEAAATIEFMATRGERVTVDPPEESEPVEVAAPKPAPKKKSKAKKAKPAKRKGRSR